MNIKTRITCFASLFIVSGWTLPALAGNGTTRDRGGQTVLDFCVSIRFTPTAAQLEAIRRVFTDGNVILADATDGQFEFGEIDLVANSGASREAEVWILPEAGRAFATFGRYGTPGEHITLYFPSNFSQSPARDGDAYTMAHEFVHHVWGIADEYSGPDGAGDCEATPGAATASFCLMDNYFTRGGNNGGTGTYTLNELCVPGNHDPDGDTYQDSLNGESCWETIAGHPTRGGVRPDPLPANVAPAVTPPVFRNPGTERRFAEVIDRSCSMADTDGGASSRMELARAAGGLVVDLTRADDLLGVVSFSTDARVDFALSAMNAANQTAARAAVNALAPDADTAIGLGLALGRDLLTGAADHSCAQTIFLMTDGFGNTGPSELSVIPSLVENDISAITVGVGGMVSDANLITIASSTRGRYFRVASAADLPALMAGLAAEATGGGVLARQPAFAPPSGFNTQVIHVDPATTELRVVLTHDLLASMALTLISPSGTIVDASLASVSAAVDFSSDTGRIIATVRGPVLEVGDWTLRVDNGTSSEQAFVLTSISDASDVLIAASSDVSQYFWPAPIVLSATPYYVGPVVDAQVFARVVRGDGSTVLLQLFDDGSVLHGDNVGGDGRYAAVFNAFRGNGSYRIDILSEAAPGSETYAGEALFASVGAPSSARSVPQFTRETSFTVLVDGVPANQPPTADAGDDQSVECSAAGGSYVQLDGTGSSDPDDDPLTFAWSAPGIVFDNAGSVRPTGFFPLGTTEVTLTVADGLHTVADTVSITVADTTPPTIAVSVSPNTLWPPNHRLVEISASATAADICDPSPDVVLTSVTSDEPEVGCGSGNHPNDIQNVSSGTADFTFDVRSERCGTMDGRIYTATYTATDGSGHSTAGSAEVGVPHDRGP